MNLLKIAVGDLFARKTRLILTILGIVTGVAALVFLLSLTAGVNKAILKGLVGSIPETELVVTPEETELLGIFKKDLTGIDLDDNRIDEIKTTIDGIDKIYGIGSLENIPTRLEGTFEPARLGTIGGLAEKIPGTRKLARDFSSDCAIFGIPRELLLSGLTDEETETMQEYDYFTDERPVPIVISRHLLEMFNMGLVKAWGLPKFSEKIILGQRFKLYFGQSDMFRMHEKQRIPPVECEVVGTSVRAPVMALTVPPQYLEDWREKYFGEPRKRIYKQLIIIASTLRKVADIETQLEEMGFDVRTNKNTIDKINTITVSVGVIFSIVGIIILIISSVGIVNVLTMAVNEEAVDIAILRAVGATKTHVRFIYFTKAAIIGVMGSVYGIFIGLIGSLIADKIALAFLKNIAYRPDSFFAATSSIILLCFLIGFGFSLIAGVLPASRAASLKPAEILSQG